MFGLRDSGRVTTLTHERLLARQLRSHSTLRYGVAVTIVVAALVARWLVEIEDLALLPLLVMAAVIATMNTGVVAIIHNLERTADLGRSRRPLLALRHTTIAADYVALATLIELVGGVRSPFVAAFVLHVVLGCVMVSRTAAWLYTGFAVLLVNGLVAAELTGILEPRLPAGAVLSAGPLGVRYAASISMVHSALLVITTALMTRLVASMRSAEGQLIETKQELERLSNARRDFLHVALHNLKSPTAAATMLLENLRLGLAGPVNDRQQDLLSRSLKRLEESRQFMKDLATLAALEAGALAVLEQPVELLPLLQRIAEEHADLVGARGQELSVAAPDKASGLVVRGSERLLHEAVVNLVTNAIKFTPRGGTITLGAEASAGVARVFVRDSGPGVPPEKLESLFREFSRLNTVLPDGERPEGSGLGLSIVRRVAEAHGGTVSVRSSPGCCAVFTIELPLTAS